MKEAKPVAKKRTYLLSTGHAFVAPAIILIILMAFYPTYKVVSMSLLKLDKRTRETEYVGLDNYDALVKTPIFGKAVKQTLSFSVFSSLGHITFGFLLALYMNANINRRVRGLRAPYRRQVRTGPQSMWTKFERP